MDYTKALDFVDHNKLGKHLERWEYQTILAVWETCMWVKKQQLEPCVEQLTGSVGIEKGVQQGCLLSPSE